MGILDIVVLSIIAISGLVAFYRGFVRELLGLIAWVLSALGAIYGMLLVRPLSRTLIENKTLADIVSAGIFALIILVIFTIVNAKITAKLRKSSLSGLDRVLGFAFGLLRGVLLIVLTYLAATIMLSEKEISRYEKGNFTPPFIRITTDTLVDLLPPGVIDDIRTKDKIEPKTIADIIEREGKIQKSFDREAEMGSAIYGATSDGVHAVYPKAKPIDEDVSYDESERDSLTNLIEEQL